MLFINDKCTTALVTLYRGLNIGLSLQEDPLVLAEASSPGDTAVTEEGAGKEDPLDLAEASSPGDTAMTEEVGERSSTLVSLCCSSMTSVQLRL